MAVRDFRWRARIVAKVVQTKRKVLEMQARLTDRNEAAREIGTAVMELHRHMGLSATEGSEVRRKTMAAIRHDLGDLTAEALKVTRL